MTIFLPESFNCRKLLISNRQFKMNFFAVFKINKSIYCSSVRFKLYILQMEQIIFQIFFPTYFHNTFYNAIQYQKVHNFNTFIIVGEWKGVGGWCILD